MPDGRERDLLRWDPADPTSPSSARRVRAHPFVKWAGGKAALLPKLRKYYPNDFGTYFEPFVGGGAVFFDLRPTSAVLSDSNAELVNAYKVVQTDVEGLIVELKALEQRYRRAPKRTFYGVRDDPLPKRSSPRSRAARFIFLNRTCYNGLYRVNLSGKFNVPFGEYDNPRICDPKGLRATSEALRGVVVRHLDYLTALQLVESGDFVYLDPPYHPVSPTANFTSYTVESFDEKRHRELAFRLAELKEKVDCRILVSSSDVPFVYDLYKVLGFKIDKAVGSRRISCKPSTRTEVSELLIRNYTRGES